MLERGGQEGVPGMTTSPKPSIPKLLASNPFSRMSMGNITTDRGGEVGVAMAVSRHNALTFDWGLEGLGNSHHHISAKYLP